MSLALYTHFQKHCSVQHLLNQQELEFLNEYIFFELFSSFLINTMLRQRKPEKTADSPALISV